MHLIQSPVHSVNGVDVKSAKGLDNCHKHGYVTTHVCAVPKQLLTIQRVCVVLKRYFTIVPKTMKWNGTVIVYRVPIIHVHVCHINVPNDGHGSARYPLYCHACGAIGRCAVVLPYVPNVMPDIRVMVAGVRKINYRLAICRVAVAPVYWAVVVVVVELVVLVLVSVVEEVVAMASDEQ